MAALAPQVRKRIRSVDADALSISELEHIAGLPEGRQSKKLDDLVAVASAHRRHARKSRVEKGPPMQARAALSLNPKRLIEDRQADEKRLDVIRKRVEDVNRRLASPQSRRKDSSALAEIERIIRRNFLGNVCSATMERTEDGRHVVLDVDDVAWCRRRRSDGIALIISHPEVQGSAPERVTRYFSKDAVEKDFQSIKSLLGLRPIRHRTDHKLRAHVSICILALLLTRLVEHQLASNGTRRTLPAIIERLEPVRLNLIDDGKRRYYAVTQPAEEAEEVLRDLSMLNLVDNAAITREITPR